MIKIAIYDLEGNFLETIEVENVRKGSQFLGMHQSSLHQCLNGTRNSAYGRQFRQVHNNRVLKHIGDITDVLNLSNTVPVHKYYNDNYICSYPNIITASEKNNNISVASISQCINGLQGRVLVGGFQWKKAE